MYTVYCDGGCLGNHQTEAPRTMYASWVVIDGGAVVMTGRSDDIPGAIKTNQVAEYHAFIAAMDSLSLLLGAKGIDTQAQVATVKTDSEFLRDTLVGSDKFGRRVTIKAPHIKALRNAATQALKWWGTVHVSVISGDDMKAILGH